MTTNTIGIDLAKNSMHVFIRDGFGKKVISRKVSRDKLLSFLKNLGYKTLVGMEACGSAHYWARRIRELGFEVKLIPPQYVKPFVKTNKSDEKDAEAIAEVVTRTNIHFVEIKTLKQQEIAIIHKVRKSLVEQRTCLMNQIRGHLREVGIFFAEGVASLKKELAVVLDASQQVEDLGTEVKEVIYLLREELHRVEEKIKALDGKIMNLSKVHEEIRRLKEIPGVGPITSSILFANYGDAKQFKCGRNFSASLGLVPRHFGTGGITKNGTMSKRGNKYIRTLLLHGARSAVLASQGKSDPLSLWIQKKRTEKGLIKAAVALANKIARIAWKILSGENIRFNTKLAAA